MFALLTEMGAIGLFLISVYFSIAGIAAMVVARPTKADFWKKMRMGFFLGLIGFAFQRAAVMLVS